MKTADVKMCVDLAQFFIDFDPYASCDAGICSEEDLTLPSVDFIKEMLDQLENNPASLLFNIESLREYIDVTYEECEVIDYYSAWLKDVVKRKAKS